ncbi:MAG: HNH endonuclease, partial [Actinobacteria bacterium]|nr:HNH endonuclease [Actinomycetota bacterium]
FTGVAPSVYTVTSPVWLVHEEPDQHQFVLAVDELTRESWQPRLAVAPMTDPVRRYAEVLRKQRLHQKVFSPRVIAAYDSQCAVCRLRHLLDAAHIKEDAAGGLPIVPNGLALCAIHHRAFDAQVLGIRPDYRLEIRADILAEHDGPTLQHALKEMHGGALVLPRRRLDRPSPELLEERYEEFRAAG